VTSDTNDREVEQLRSLLREHGLLSPIGDDAGDEHGGDQLLTEILTGRRRPVRARQPRFLVPAAAAVAVAVAAGAWGIWHGEPAEASPTPAMLHYATTAPEHLATAPSADQTFHVAADAVSALAPSKAVGGTQYVSTYGWLLDAQAQPTGPVATTLYPTVTDSWLSSDGAMRVDQSRGAALGLDGRATGSGVVAGGQTASDTAPAGSVDPQWASQMTQLASDTAGLTSALLATQAALPCTQDLRWQAECLLQATQQVYSQYVMDPKLAAGIWNVLADNSSFRLLGATVDRLGREATGIGLASDPANPASVVTVLLVSPRDGTFLGTETITLADQQLSISKPTVTSFSALTAARWVAQRGDR
jgi:hypothetical protein